MARAPEILWHFEHMPAGEPSHVQSRSVVHGLSSPRPNGDQGQSYVAGLGVGGGTGVEAGMRFHCWSFVTPSGPHDSPLMYLVPPNICIAVMQIVSPPNLDLSVIVWSPFFAHVLVLREHLQKLPPRSLVGDAERDSREMGPSTPSIGPGSVPAYVPGMGKAT